MSAPDPILAAIAHARTMEAAHIAALENLDEDDPAQMCRANAAADRDTAAWFALDKITPATMAGLVALMRFYAESYARDEPTSMAGEQFGRLAAVLGRCDPGLVLPQQGRIAA